MEIQRKTYIEYWGYVWRIDHRHAIPGIFQWDEDLVELVLRVCPVSAGARVLDLGCAGGDQAKVFARRGYAVVGVDQVPSLVEYARDSFAEEGLSGEFVVGDMRDIAYAAAFDLCVIFSGTFGYFSDEGNRELLAKILRALRPGGYAFIDYIPVEYWAKVGRQKSWDEIDGGFALSETWFDVPTSTYRSSLRHVLTDGTVIGYTDEEGNPGEVIRGYTAREIENLASEVGFAVVGHLTTTHVGSHDYDPEPDEPRGMLALRKPG